MGLSGYGVEGEWVVRRNASGASMDLLLPDVPIPRSLAVCLSSLATSVFELLASNIYTSTTLLVAFQTCKSCALAAPFMCT